MKRKLALQVLLAATVLMVSAVASEGDQPYKVENVSDRFIPSGWMGDYGALSYNPSCGDGPHSGDSCIEILYTGEKTQGAGWAGIYWQYPENNWGDEEGQNGTFTGATNLTFWARGKEGDEKAEFKMGGIAGKYSDSVRPAKSTGIISLSNEWQQYSIDLTGKNLSQVIGGFCWVAKQQQNLDGCIIYLDDIRYEWDIKSGVGRISVSALADDSTIEDLGSSVTSENEATSDSVLKLSAPHIYGLNLGPFLGGKDPNLSDQVSEEELRTLIEIIVLHTEWIRTFGCGSGQENAGQIAHEMGLKTAVGAWLSSDLAANEQEISSLINCSKSGQADLLIVGSEVILRGDLSEEQLIDYIGQVKEETSGILVTTACTHDTILSHPNLVSAVDVVFVNYYPYWGGVGIDQALEVLDKWHQDVLEVSGEKEVIISETGWPSCGNQVGDAVPSPENAARYFRDFVSWAQANEVPYFYFEAFDEQWKVGYGEGPQGACWGIWYEGLNLKPGFNSGVSVGPYKVVYVSDRFVPSNYNGDYGDIKLNLNCVDEPYSKPNCTEIIYSANWSDGFGWAGIDWVYPAHNRGGMLGHEDVFTNATKLTFWAKGKNGTERVAFKMGGITGKHSDSVNIIKSIEVTLSQEWQQYSIDLTEEDLSHVIRGFSWVAKVVSNKDGCAFYLDDIRYEWW